MELTSYASDLLEDAMVLAQTKSINSFSFRDTINTLTELWGYCYERMCRIDPGYYSKTMKLHSKLTKLPPYVKNTILVYSSRDSIGYSRQVFTKSGNNDLNSPQSYHISGRDLYCWAGDMRNVFVEYVPEPPFLTFTKNNRDAKILWKPGDRPENIPEREPFNRYFQMYTLQGDWTPSVYPQEDVDDIAFEFAHQLYPDNPPITVDRLNQPNWTIRTLILDFPWTFVTYQQNGTGGAGQPPAVYESFVIGDLLGSFVTNLYNPFDFQGRPSNVEFIKAKYNDYTGMGVTVLDHSDGKYKELGWTPDTILHYPSRIVYNYMVASMAQRFAALNGASVMAVEMALVQAQSEMGNWLKKDKSAWMRANNVTGPTLADFL